MQPEVSGSDRQEVQVLVAEDEPSVSRIVQLLLEDEGITVAIARDGREALGLTRLLRPALLLLDIQLPISDGPEVARQVIEEFGGQRPKIVLLSAGTNIGDLVGQLGIDGHVNKPFEPDELLRVVQGFLGLNAI